MHPIYSRHSMHAAACKSCIPLSCMPKHHTVVQPVPHACFHCPLAASRGVLCWLWQGGKHVPAYLFVQPFWQLAVLCCPAGRGHGALEKDGSAVQGSGVHHTLSPPGLQCCLLSHLWAAGCAPSPQHTTRQQWHTDACMARGVLGLAPATRGWCGWCICWVHVCVWACVLLPSCCRIAVTNTACTKDTTHLLQGGVVCCHV